MLATTTLLLGATLAGAAGPLVPPSVAVMPVRPKAGLSQDVADLLTGALTSSVRAQARFSRVVGPSDIEALLDFERRKQLVDCGADSCMADIAGALGVDYLLATTVGPLGDDWIINASLIRVKSSEAVASTSRTVPLEHRSAVTLVFDEMVVAVCAQAGLGGPTRQGTPAPAAGTKRVVVREEAAPSVFRPWMGTAIPTAVCAPLPPVSCLASIAALVGSLWSFSTYTQAFAFGPRYGLQADAWCGLSVGACLGSVGLLVIAVLGGLGALGGGTVTAVLATVDRVIGNVETRALRDTDPEARLELDDGDVRAVGARP